MSNSIPYRLANGPGNPPDARKFMANYDWITALIYGTFIENGGFEEWNDATSYTNPATSTGVADAWTFRKSGTSGPSTNVAREATTIDDGTYSTKLDITSAGSADSLSALDQVLPQSEKLRGYTICFGGKVKVSSASKVRLKITDGTTTSYSAYHTGGGTFEQLNVALTVAAAASTITVSVEVTSDFTGQVYVDSLFAYVIPSSMTTAARALLAWDKLIEKGSR